jgi:DNA uptake protein ComE-like DNA-binding protein
VPNTCPIDLSDFAIRLFLMGNKETNKEPKKWPRITLIGLAALLAISVIIGANTEPSEQIGQQANSGVDSSAIPSEAQENETSPAEPTAPSSDDEAVSSESNSEALARPGDSQAAAAALASSSWDELLSLLTIEPEFQNGYDRSLFRHWIDESGNGCDTRREVLIRESLTPVTVGSGCSISGGSWFSAFDGVTTTNPSEFDIDHLVPLKEAWDSGAHSWDANTRRAFANDLELVDSLIAVSARSNRSKGDRDPADWMPPRVEYHCHYIASWVKVKIKWQLSVDQTEKNAIRRTASSCDNSTLSGPAPSPTATSSAAPSQRPQESQQTTTPSPSRAPASSESCLPGQININTASREELQLIRHIGADRADEIISLRSTRKFSSLDGLDAVSGIALGGTRLQQIKDEGLACVG